MQQHSSTIKLGNLPAITITTPVEEGRESRSAKAHREKVRAELAKQREHLSDGLPLTTVPVLITKVSRFRTVVTFAEDAGAASDPDAHASLHRSRVNEARAWSLLDTDVQDDPWVLAINCEKLPGGRMVLPDGSNVGLRRDYTTPKDATLKIRRKLEWCKERLEFLAEHDDLADAGWAVRERAIVENAIARHQEALAPAKNEHAKALAAARSRKYRAAKSANTQTERVAA